MLMPSAGTARVLGLNKMKLDDPPTCAYIMVGKKCRGSCLFCAQRTDSDAGNDEVKSDFLSRITWKPQDDEKVLQSIVEKYGNGSMKRVCFQAVQGEGIFERTLSSLKSLKNSCDIPVCVSINGITLENLKELYTAGAENIAFSFDAATSELFEKIKGTNWSDEWSLYEEANLLFPGKTVIHLIVGLGETEEEMARAIVAFYLRGSEVSLFAFTPIPGTPLAKKRQPPMNSYRKLQAALFLIRKIGIASGNGNDGLQDLLLLNLNNTGELKGDAGKYAGKKEISGGDVFHNARISAVFKVLEEYFRFEKGKIIFNPGNKEFLLNYLTSEAFRTYGCPDCNRPLYNERPGRVPYNYPRELKEAELREAVDSLF